MLRIAQIESRRYTLNKECYAMIEIVEFYFNLLILRTFYFIIFSLPIFIVAEQLQPREPHKKTTVVITQLWKNGYNTTLFTKVLIYSFVDIMLFSNEQNFNGVSKFEVKEDHKYYSLYHKNKIICYKFQFGSYELLI